MEKENDKKSMNSIQNSPQRKKDTKQLKKIYVIEDDFDQTNDPPLALDNYLLDSEIHKIIDEEYIEPNRGWENWSTLYKEVADNYFSKPYSTYEINIFGFKNADV